MNLATDLRVHLAVLGAPACGAADDGPVNRMLTAFGPAVTCAACLASAAFMAEIEREATAS